MDFSVEWECGPGRAEVTLDVLQGGDLYSLGDGAQGRQTQHGPQTFTQDTQMHVHGRKRTGQERPGRTQCGKGLGVP